MYHAETTECVDSSGRGRGEEEYQSREGICSVVMDTSKGMLVEDPRT